MSYRRKLWFAVSFLFFSLILVSAQNTGLVLTSGATRIVLPPGWEPLDQPKTYLTQARALQKDKAIALSAGAFRVDMPFEQQLAIGLLGMTDGPDTALAQVAEMTRIPATEITKMLESLIGGELLNKVREGSREMPAQLLSFNRLEISGAPAVEIHSKMTVLKTGQILYARIFTYEGNLRHQVVNITYVSPSDDIFQDETLLNAIKRPAASVPSAPSAPQAASFTVVREAAGGFSYSIPPSWAVFPNKNKAQEPTLQFDKVKGPMVDGIPSAMITPLGWNTSSIDEAIREEAKHLAKLGATSINLTEEGFTTRSEANGVKIARFGQIEPGRYIDLYAFTLSNSRVVTFLCWPAMPNDEELKNTYEQVLKSFQFNGAP